MTMEMKYEFNDAVLDKFQDAARDEEERIVTVSVTVYTDGSVGMRLEDDERDFSALFSPNAAKKLKRIFETVS